MSARRHLRIVARLLLLALLALPAVPVLAQGLARSAGLALAADICTGARAADDGMPAPVQHGGAHCPLCCTHAGGAIPASATLAPAFGSSPGRERLAPTSECGSDERGMRPEARAPPGSHCPSA
ncbi:MAG: DUF2946 family protein [Methyloversatilis discipulorum]|uniref:DUF2946 family protein n=1 Tax=Methyloversatilis discipulorum TaxID=1119528 RepID=UPI0026F0F020|nr:DUF2946 family protein [Methyloversatilis discipulorum]MBT9515634.1 DUF2946 family protein [Methyloversatilis discipulorum]